MRSTLFLAPILVLTLLLVACAPNTQPTDQPVTQPAASDESPVGDSAAAAQAARLALAERLGVDARDVAVEKAEPRDWSDSCLGLGGPAESCLAAITPGYAVTLVHDGTDYAYRTDERGTAVRAE